jgi:restriction system protein
MRQSTKSGTGPKSERKGPEFVSLFAPLLEALRELGDSGRPKEVSNRIAATLAISEGVLNRTNKNGQSRFENQVAWARFYLARGGLIDTSQRGVWRLTESGRRTRLDHKQALEIFNRVQIAKKDAKSVTITATTDAIDDTAPPNDTETAGDDYQEELAKILLSLSPSGFERLCQRILREVGFEEVIVTGRSNDGGIDGYGILRINRLVSDRVIFQCKRHAKTISPSYIREFRGSMSARADRGIFLATSTFSVEAKEKRRATEPFRLRW